MKTALQLTKELVALSSITPSDHGCQDLLRHELEPLGFVCETIQAGDVTNLWARRGTAGPLFVLAGHTDVVPTGPAHLWTYSPFEPTEADGNLYGRGTSDMKASIAAMLVAVREFVAQHPDHAGSIAFLITSDEEGPAVNGTK
ncbi:MAG TPA: M20/M25/M40 family metallo-hydrolase, partial [Burkholderiaceae bacterium]